MIPFTHRMRLPRLLLAGAGLAVLAGCADGPPTRYYTLAETTVPAVPAARGAAPGSSVLYVELAPLTLPERLMRPQLVVRRATAEGVRVDVLEQHRWAASFESELRDALAAGVATRLGAIDTSRGGRPASQPAVRIHAQLRQFDAQEGRGIDAVFTWTVRRGDEGAAMACRLDVSEVVQGGEGGESNGGGIAALARSAQRLTVRVADAMAESVRAGPARQASCLAA